MSKEFEIEARTEILQRRNRELTILNVIAEALNREVNLTRALRTVLVQVTTLFDLHTAWVWLLRDDTGDSYLAASYNLPPALSDNPQLMEGNCYCLRTYREGDLEGAANVNVVTCSRLRGLVDGTGGLRYHSSIPLYASDERRLGVLNVVSSDWRELSDEDLRILNTVGELLSIAIERARLFERSTELGAVEERNRLAREIHDTLAQGLAAIALQLDTAEAHLDANNDIGKVRSAIHQALILTQGNLEEARRSVLDLRAAPLERRTLAEALKTLLEDTSSQANIRTDFKFTGGMRPLSPRIEAGLYRIAAEALANVVRHSKADAVVVRLSVSPIAIELSLEDDGDGFDASETSDGRYGVIGMNERAKLLGGSMNVESSEGIGTRIEIRVPIESAEGRISEGKH